MYKTIPKSKVIVSLLITAILSIAILSACSNDEDEKPKIIDCDTVRHKGTDWTL